MRKRLTIDEETNQNQNDCSCGSGGSGDCDRRSVVRGYCKLFLLIFFFTAILLCRFFVADVVTVSGSSMETTFLNGDVLLMQPRVESLERGDVVVAKVGHIKVIKRVVGLPYDTVQIVDGVVLLNGVVLEEEYCEATHFAGVASEPYVLSDGEYFLMGDNRDGSEDSRVYGGVQIENIRGIVTHKIYPFNGFGKLINGTSEDD